MFFRVIYKILVRINWQITNVAEIFQGKYNQITINYVQWIAYAVLMYANFADYLDQQKYLKYK